MRSSGSRSARDPVPELRGQDRRSAARPLPAPGRNERSRSLEPITLREYLGNIRRYLTLPLSWKGSKTSLLAERDTRVLVSAQACFLPVPREGKAEFNPVLFNYQSYAQNPAVLTILVTREGTSATVIDNTRDAFATGGSWGQRLFFNLGGQRAVLSAERLSDFTDKQQAQQRKNGQAVTEPAKDAALDMVLLIQVPLKQAPRPARDNKDLMGGAPCCDECCPKALSDVESAVIGHGKVEGPFTEIADLGIERDERFPVRVTVQFYKATSNGVVSESDMSEVAKQIGSVYASAENVGSLVTQGETGRPTEHSGTKLAYPTWWSDFWARHERNTGLARGAAIERLEKTLGSDWRPASETDLSRGIEVAGLGKLWKIETSEPEAVAKAPEPLQIPAIEPLVQPVVAFEASDGQCRGLYLALAGCVAVLGLGRIRRGG